MPSPRGMVGGQIGFVTAADGVRLAYTEHGTGPPVVFVRGWITHLELMWAEAGFRRFFKAVGRLHRVVRFDARANGLSDRDVSQLDLDAFTLDVEAVMDGLGLEVVTLWGSGFGGPIAVTYAARHPDRVDRLVLEGTFARGRDIGSPEYRRTIAAMAGALLQTDPEPALAALSYITDPEPTTPHERRIARVRASIDPRTLAELYDAAGHFDVSDLLRTLEVPTLVLHRRQSRMFRLEAGRAIATLVPRARFASLEGAAHNPWEGDAEEALLALGSFLGDGDALVRALGELEAGTAASLDVGPGMITILFTDLVGSTAIATDLGDAGAQVLLREHNTIVREALRAHAGVEVKGTGDGIMATFSAASPAVAAAVEIQRRFEKRERSQPDTPMAVRIGINAGEPIKEDHDLFGTPVNLAARLCRLAAPGQILVSNVVRELTAGKGLAFKRLADANLRGFPEPVPVYAVER